MSEGRGVSSLVDEGAEPDTHGCQVQDRVHEGGHDRRPPGAPVGVGEVADGSQHRGSGHAGSIHQVASGESQEDVFQRAAPDEDTDWFEAECFDRRYGRIPLVGVDQQSVGQHLDAL